jgi:hypothetical protein
MKQLKLKISILNTLITSRPLLIYLIMIMVYILLYIYLANPIQCQGLDGLTETSIGAQDLVAQATQERLESLHNILESDIVKCEKAVIKYNNIIEIYNEARTRPERNNGLEHLIGHGVTYYLDETIRCFSKIRLTEAMIKTLDRSYVSEIPKQRFEQF